MRLFLIAVVVLLLTLAMARDVRAKDAAAKRPPLATTAVVDLPRFMGAWSVIANIPYFGERGKVETSDVYALLPDGRIDNTYVYRKSFDKKFKDMKGLATVVPGTNNAQWKIAFFGGLLKADYLILEVAPDYSWALIGHPKREMGWVFARDKQMDEALYQSLLGKMAGYGYDTTKFRKVPQKREQLGQPGFQ